MAHRQLQEVLEDDGTNVPRHFKAIGFVNGLEMYQQILAEQIELYKQKAEAERAEKISIPAES